MSKEKSSPNGLREIKQDQNKLAVLEQLRKIPIIQVACERAGVNRASFYRWYKTDKKFEKMVTQAILEGVDMVNDMAESQLISAIKDKNLSAITYWLRHRHRVYTNKLKTINDQEIKEKLTRNQTILLKQALRLASLKPPKQTYGQ